MTVKLRAALLALFTALTVGLIAIVGGLPATAAAAPYQNVLKFYKLGINGYNMQTQVAGSGTDLLLSVGWSDSHYLPYEAPTVVLQRQIEQGAWTTVATAAQAANAPLTASTGVYRVPAQVARQVVRYRFVGLESTTTQGYVWQAASSDVITITYDNQQRYTGLAKSIYGYMRSYCPTSAVRIVPNGSGYESAGTYHEGTTLIDISSVLRGYKAVDRRTVALHECTHQRQFLNYGGTSAGWQAMGQALQKVFKADRTPRGVRATRSGHYTGKFSAIEHAADCAALSLNPRGYLGYGGYCNRQELRAGKLLLTGHRI